MQEIKLQLLLKEWKPKFKSQWSHPRTSPVVQWASTAGSVGSIPGEGTKIPHAAWGSQKKNQLASQVALTVKNRLPMQET